ncbi:MAG: FHA domain-containing protein [Deltaproteobacteria bacterium]|nr:FHA domain-containing protein [Deltaproteobacteria bacterium]
MNVRLEDVEEIRFVVVQGATTGSRVTFAPEPRTVRIGRAVDNDIVLNDPAVSRAHARVDISADGARIQDLGSAGGVEKMGFRLGAAAEPLVSGDEFKIGATILRYELLLKRGAVRRAAKPEEEAAKKKAALPAPRELVGAVSKSLRRFGLRTPASQILALAAVAALLVVAFWPSKPGLPPQAGAEPAPINFEAVVGYVPGGDQSHLDGAVFEIPTDADAQAIYFKVNAPHGIDVRVGKQVIVSQKPSGDWRDLMLLVIPRAVSGDGAPQFVLDNLGYAPADGGVDPAAAPGWAVARMWAARVAAGATLQAQVTADAKILETLSTEVAQDSRELYRLVAGLRSLAVGLMKLAGRPVIVLQLGGTARGDLVTPALRSAREALEGGQNGPALDRLTQALGAAESRLDREYRERFNALQLLQKRGAGQEVGALLASLEPWIPEPTDPRHREILSQKQNLDAAAQYGYDEAKKKAELED